MLFKILLAASTALASVDITMQNCYDDTCSNCDASFTMDTSDLQTDASSCSDWKQALGIVATPVDGEDFDWGDCVEISTASGTGYGIYNSCHMDGLTVGAYIAIIAGALICCCGCAATMYRNQQRRNGATLQQPLTGNGYSNMA